MMSFLLLFLLIGSCSMVATYTYCTVLRILGERKAERERIAVASRDLVALPQSEQAAMVKRYQEDVPFRARCIVDEIDRRKQEDVPLEYETCMVSYPEM